MPLIPTEPTLVYQYELYIKVKTTDIDQVRKILQNIALPIQVNSQINISNIHIATGKKKHLTCQIYRVCSLI